MNLILHDGNLYCYHTRRRYASPWPEYYNGELTFRSVVHITKSVALAHLIEDMQNEEHIADRWHAVFAGYRKPRQLCVFFTDEEFITTEYFQENYARGLWLHFERRYFGLFLLNRLHTHLKKWLRHRQIMRQGLRSIVRQGRAHAVFSDPELLGLIMLHISPKFNIT